MLHNKRSHRNEKPLHHNKEQPWLVISRESPGAAMNIQSSQKINTSFSSGSDGKASCLQCGRPGFNPWIRKIPWRRKWQPTPVLLSGKSHGWRSLVGYSPWGRKELDTTERLQFQFPSIPTIKRTQEAMSSVGLQRAQFWVREEQNGELLSLKMEGAFVILHSKYPI